MEMTNTASRFSDAQQQTKDLKLQVYLMSRRMFINNCLRLRITVTFYMFQHDLLCNIYVPRRSNCLKLNETYFVA